MQEKRIWNQKTVTDRRVISDIKYLRKNSCKYVNSEMKVCYMNKTFNAIKH